MPLPFLLLLISCAEPPPQAIVPTVPSLSAEQKAGRVAFRATCAACHGLLADGQGPAAAALLPAPADLRGSGVRLGEETLRRRIRDEAPGSAMQGFGERLGEDLDPVVTWLMTLEAQLPPP